MGKHIAIQTSDVGEFLPFISWHFADDVALPVNHFVMGEGQHKVFAVVVPHAEGEVVLVELAEPRIHVEVVQHVVHPAHIPFEIEAQTAHISRPGDHGPGGGFFGDR